MQNKLDNIFKIIAAALLAVVLYILFHETGHLIVMLSAGDTIDDFSILTAHVSGHGGEYTPFSAMWLHANGAFLPYAATMVYMLFYKKDSESKFYIMFSQMIASVVIGSMLAWVIVPFIYMQGQAPAGDDVTKFLDVFGGSPLIVGLAALLLTAAGIAVMLCRQIIRNFAREIKAGQ